ncbi:MAG: diguanylate cyclase, partial [Rhizobacter sp.]|nr:diguanylate cyclase [Rhizobacter sp.]
MSSSAVVTGPKNRVGRLALAFVVFGCAALIGLNAWLAMRARDVQIGQAAVATTNLANAVSQQVNSTFAEVDHTLAALVFDIERSEFDAAALQRIQPVLVNYVSQMDELRGLFVYDAKGAWVVNSEPTWDEKANNADREYFKFHQANPSQDVHIGTPIMSRSTQAWVIPVSRRIDDRDGRFAGVILATVDVERLNAFLNRFNIGAAGAIALTLADGHLLVRRPFVVKDLGRSIVGDRIYDLISAGRSGTSWITSPFDQHERIISFDHLDRYGVIAVAALSREDVLAEWMHATALQTACVLLVSLAFAAVGAYVVMLIGRGVRSQARLRELRDQLTQTNISLAFAARQDGLTGLANRRHFDESLKREAQIARRQQSPLSLVMIDIDHFKTYNDRYGHQAGDECLRAVAQAVAEVVHRPGDVVARYGGEELVLLLPNTDIDGAATVAEAARVAVHTLQRRHEDSGSGVVSVSIGVASHPGRDLQDDGTATLRKADEALYAAKHGGRDRVCRWHADGL